MTASRHPDLLIDAFLAEGTTELHDGVFDAVRGELHRTRQRIVVGPLREPRPATLSRLAIAAAIVASLSLAWINFSKNLGPGGPTPALTETVALPSASIPVVGAEVGEDLAPGRWAFEYERAAGANGVAGPTVVVTIPSEGWTRFGQFAADKNYGPSGAEAGPSFVMWNVVDIYVNGCNDTTLVSPRPGRTVETLLTALANQPLVEAGPITAVTVDGYLGAFVEITTPHDIAECIEGAFWPFVEKYTQAPGEIDRVYAIDVDGFLLTFFARIPENTTLADRLLLEQLLDSIEISP